MKIREIQCGIHYKAVHNIECYRSSLDPSLPKSELEDVQTVSIPYHEKLTSTEIHKVIKEIKNVGISNFSWGP